MHRSLTARCVLRAAGWREARGEPGLLCVGAHRQLRRHGGGLSEASHQASLHACMRAPRSARAAHHRRAKLDEVIGAQVAKQRGLKLRPRLFSGGGSSSDDGEGPFAETVYGCLGRDDPARKQCIAMLRSPWFDRSLDADAGRTAAAVRCPYRASLHSIGSSCCSSCSTPLCSSWHPRRAAGRRLLNPLTSCFRLSPAASLPRLGRLTSKSQPLPRSRWRWRSCTLHSRARRSPSSLRASASRSGATRAVRTTLSAAQRRQQAPPPFGARDILEGRTASRCSTTGTSSRVFRCDRGVSPPPLAAFA